MKYLFLTLTIFYSLTTFSQEEETIEKKWNTDYGTEVEIENQFFLNEGIYDGQRQYFLSAALKPFFMAESIDNRHSFSVSLFCRLSASDPRRSHFDVREAFYRYEKNNWSVSLGSKKVFWGVTELAHLVDIVNQTDFLEGFDGEEKLGQPMLQITTSQSFGNFEAYYLPFSRRLSFPSRFGRYRFPVVLETNDIPFRNEQEQWYPSFAARWYKTLAGFDLGISAFHGTSREPLYLGFNPISGLDLSYPIINQLGLDVQYLFENWLFKTEAIYRTTQLQDFFAIISGFEYTFGNVKNSGLDIGLVSEYIYDSRKLLTFSGLDNDVFVGTRLAFNDTKNTEMLVGGVFDVEKSTKLFSIEASRRIGNSFKVNLQGNILSQVSDKEVLYNFRQDDFIQISISKFF